MDGKTMSISFAKRFVIERTVALLMLVSALGGGIGAAAGVAKAADAPAGSLVLRGSKGMGSADSSRSAFGTNSPEHLFGLRMEEAIKTNGLEFIWKAFDVDAFYRRCVPSLPVSDETRQRLYAAPHQNTDLRKLIAQDLLGDIKGLPHTRFLGTRLLGDDCALLFRDGDGTGAAFERVTPMYIAYIAGRQPDGSVRLVDAHRFRSGELMSQTMRRRMLTQLAKDQLLMGDRLSVADRQ